jgi:hypothetical protein
VNLEEQLRDAFVAAAETVRPATIRDCPPPSGPGRLRRWSRSVPVLAAAASVVAIVVGGSVAASLLSSGSHGRQAASRYRASSGPVTGPVPAATPQYFIEHFTNGSDLSNPLSVRDVVTGRVVGQLTPPSGMAVSAIAAVGNGRTFLAAASLVKTCGTSRLYRIEVAGQGRSIAKTPLRVSALDGIQVAALATASGGDTVAYMGNPAPKCNTEEIGVVDLATGRATRWSLGGFINFGDLTLTADGRLLSFTGWLNKATTEVGPVVVTLPTTAPPGPALQRGHIVRPSASSAQPAQPTVASAVLSADGTRLYGCTTEQGPHVDTLFAMLREYDAATGRPLRVLHSWRITSSFYAELITRKPAFPGIGLCDLTRAASGDALLMRILPNDLARVNPATGHTTQVPTTGLPYGQPVTLAW